MLVWGHGPRIDAVLVMALPALGKSELRKHLASADEQTTASGFGLEGTVHLGDLSYVSDWWQHQRIWGRWTGTHFLCRGLLGTTFMSAASIGGTTPKGRHRDEGCLWIDGAKTSNADATAA